MSMHSDNITVMGRRFDSARPVYFDAVAGATLETVVLDTLARLRRDKAYSPAQAEGLLRYARCRVDGVEIPRANWAITRPAPGARVEVLRTVHGGGGGGKSPVIAVLGIAIMTAAWYMAPAAASLNIAGTVNMAWGGMGAAAIGGITYGNIAAFGGIMALNGLASMFSQPPSLALTSGDAGSDSPTYSISGARNAANTYGFVPLVLGTHRHTPPQGAKSWSSWDSDTQSFNMLVVWGHKDIEVSDFCIGETPLDDFSEVNHQFHQATTGDDLTLFGKSYNEQSIGTVLTEEDGWVERAVGECEEIIVDISFNGLANINKTSGKRSDRSVEFEVQYQEVGATEWLNNAKVYDLDATSYEIGEPLEEGILVDPLPTCIRYDVSNEGEYVVTRGAYGVTTPPAAPAGSVPICSVLHGFTITLTDLRESSVTGFAPSLSVTDGVYTLDIAAGTATVGNVVATRAQTTYCVESFSISNLTRADRKIRIRRVTADTDSQYILDEATLATVRAVLNESPINSPLPLCVSELRIQATDQLSGYVDDFNALCSSKLPTWNGADWDTVAVTANPAAHMRYLLTNRQGLSSPYTTAKLDDTALTALYERCAAEGHEFNFVCDSEQALWARLAQVLSAGRAAVTTDVDGLWGAAIDQPGKTAKQLFTPRNSWGFKTRRGFMELPHALRVSFVDEDDDYNTAERFVYADGYDKTNATNIVAWDYPGVTNRDDIWRAGRRHLAKLLHRQMSITLSTDWEWLGVHRGDLVGVASDVLMNVFGTARIQRLLFDVGEDALAAMSEIPDSWTVLENGEVLVGREEDIPLDELDEPLVPIGMQLDDTVVFSDPSPARYGIAIRDRASGVTTYEITPEYGEERDVLRFAYAIPAATAPDLGTLVSVSILGEEYAEYLLAGVTPGENLSAELTMIPYAMDEIEASVSGVIPAYEPSARLDVTRGKTVTAPTVTAVQSDEGALVKGADGTLISRIVVSYSLGAGQPVETVNVQYRESVSLQWLSAPSVSPGSPAVVSPVMDGVEYDVRIRAVTQAGAASDWTVVPAHTVEGKTNPPPDVENVAWSVESGALRLSWDVVDVLDLKEYLVKDELNNEVFRGLATSCPVPPQGAGSRDFTVWAIDTVENPSETGTVVSVEVTAPGQPSVDAEIDGRNVLLSWTKPTAFFPLAFSEVLYGAELGTATVIDAGLITTSRQVPGTAGAHRFWVRYTDTAGNAGSAGSVDITITAPGPVTVTPQVIDNNVLLSWTQPVTGTLPLDGYEIRRGATWAFSTPIGTVGGRFSAFFEAVAGNYTYWVAAVDTAGNVGTPASTSAVVDQPPDYVLFEDMLSDLDGTLTNCLAAADGGLLMPVNTTETWEEHFTNNSWSSPQDQIDAGYPYFLEPTPATATYQEAVDYGTVLAGTKVTITPTSEIITGAVSLTCEIETSENGSDWTSLGTLWSVYATNFRYIRITITASPDGGSNDLLRLVSVRVRLDVKLRNDAGMADCLAADASGTEVEFNVPFVDVQSITVTPAAGGSAKYALYDFTDIPNPSGFNILLYDGAGNRVDGSASWSVKGV